MVDKTYLAQGRTMSSEDTSPENNRIICVVDSLWRLSHLINELRTSLIRLVLMNEEFKNLLLNAEGDEINQDDLDAALQRIFRINNISEDMLIYQGEPLRKLSPVALRELIRSMN